MPGKTKRLVKRLNVYHAVGSSVNRLNVYQAVRRLVKRLNA